MKLSIFVALAVIASAAAVPVARDTQTLPSLLSKLGLTQDQQSVLGKLLNDLGLSPAEGTNADDIQTLPDLL
ncbi:hypothetical protein E3P96_04162, partial [Wallemia ichthyophaga]